MDADRHRQFAKLFLENQRRIYRFVLTLWPNPTEAEELFQQTSLTMWENWASFDLDRPLLPWAFTIAQNHVRNHRRKLARRDDQVLSEQVLDRLAQTAAQAQARLDRRAEALDRCLAELPERNRALLRAHYVAERPVAELAEQHGLTTNAVYKTLRRVRAALLDCMGRGAEGASV